jgi:hypothetical protein
VFGDITGRYIAPPARQTSIRSKTRSLPCRKLSCIETKIYAWRGMENYANKLMGKKMEIESKELQPENIHSQ